MLKGVRSRLTADAHMASLVERFATARPLPVGRALVVAIALLKGSAYRLWFRLTRRRVTIGRHFRVFGRVRVRGPGSVIIGDNVEMHGTVTPYTHDRAARIVIGDRVILDSTRFGCANEIVVGADCLLAEASLMDTDMHSLGADRRQPGAPVRSAPVVLEENVWVGQWAILLRGTRVGRNSVVSSGAVCAREYPANVVIMGNPARAASPIPGAASPADDPVRRS